MCSSMCREFGLTGDWRSQASQVVLLLSRRLSRSSRRRRCVRSAARPGVVETPVGRVIASALARSTALRAGSNDRPAAAGARSRFCQHDALVGLHGQLGQQLDGLPVVAHRERLEPNTVCSSTRCSRRVCSRCPYSSQLSMPTLSWLATSFSKGRKRRLIIAPG